MWHKHVLNWDTREFELRRILLVYAFCVYFFQVKCLRAVWVRFESLSYQEPIFVSPFCSFSHFGICYALSMVFCKCMLSIFLFCSGTPITACGTSTSWTGTQERPSCAGCYSFMLFCVFFSGQMFACRLSSVREFVLSFFVLPFCYALSMVFCKCMLSIFLFCSGTPVTACGTSVFNRNTHRKIIVSLWDALRVFVIFRVFLSLLIFWPLLWFYWFCVLHFCVVASKKTNKNSMFRVFMCLYLCF